MISFDDVDVDTLSFIGEQESQYLVGLAYFTDDIERLLSGSQDYVGATLPWKKTHDFVRFRPGETTIWAGINGHGKALCVDTPIPTPDGFSKIGDLMPGDSVFDEKGQVCKVVQSTGTQHDRPRYKLTFSDKTEVIADANHEWLTWSAAARNSHRNSIKNGKDHFSASPQSHKRRHPEVVTTEDIANTIRVSGGCWDGMLEHSVMTSAPIDLPDRELPLDPYAFGLWLGDGDSYGGGFTTADTELLSAFTACGMQVTNRAGPYHYGIRGAIKITRGMGVYKNKHIPIAYLRSSQQQRIDLLSGLIDTDGHVTDYGRCEITTVKKRLAEDVLDLVLSLGIQARMLVGRAKLDGRDCGEKYRITFTPDFVCARLKRKSLRLKSSISIRARHRYIEKAERISDGPTVCIEVDSPSHLFLCGRQYIPTHNSMISGMTALWMMEKQAVCIASLEMPVRQTIRRMLRQQNGVKAPTVEMFRRLKDWCPENFVIYDQTDTVAADRILGMMHYAARELAVKQIFLDSLVKCGLPTDDYNAQARLMDKLCWVAKTEDIHIHVVMHMRKGRDEKEMPGKFDIKGAGELTDLADNVLVCWRNKRKEAEYEKHQACQPNDYSDEDPDTVLTVHKQRHGEWENSINLWFDDVSQAYLSSPSADIPAFPWGV